MFKKLSKITSKVLAFFLVLLFITTPTSNFAMDQQEPGSLTLLRKVVIVQCNAVKITAIPLASASLEGLDPIVKYINEEFDKIQTAAETAIQRSYKKKEREQFAEHIKSLYELISLEKAMTLEKIKGNNFSA